MKKETVVIQKELFAENKSSLAKYQDLVIGQRGWWALIRYELIVTFCSWVPGALGLVLRKFLYPKLFKKVGRNVNFGSNIVIRHPNKIEIGDNVVIDDNCVLDAKGSDNDGIRVGNGVFLGRNSILSCKNGDIILGDHVNIGFHSEIFSASKVQLGKHVLIAAYCYLIGGDHDYDAVDKAVLEQTRSSRGITLEDDVWLGAGVKIMDGVTVGKHTIIGTSAVVNKDLPEYVIAVGIPAKVAKHRKVEGENRQAEKESESRS